mgnify:CR=1 FL=1
MNQEETKNKIYKLSEEYDNGNCSVELENELRELLEPFKKGSIGLAQINPIAGDIEYNSQKVVKYIKHAQNIGLDVVVFPELTLIVRIVLDGISFPFFSSEKLRSSIITSA